VTARHTHIAHPLLLGRALVEGGMILNDAVFTQRIALDGAELRGSFSAQATQFNSFVRLYGTVFGAVEARDDTPGTAHEIPERTRPRRPPAVTDGTPAFVRGAVFEQGVYAERTPVTPCAGGRRCHSRRARHPPVGPPAKPRVG